MRLRTHAATKTSRLRESPRRIMPSPLCTYILDVGGRGLVDEVGRRRVRVRVGRVRLLGKMGRGR
jgi:hypothetical protein